MNTIDPDPSEQQTIQLKSLDGTLPENATELGEGTFRCEPEDALEHIREGRAELTEIQAHPPFHILRELDTILERLDKIGPDWRDRSRLQKFQDKALEGGVRRTMVEGWPLNWIEGISNLQKDFVTLFEMGETPLGSLLKQIEACWFLKQSRYYQSTVMTKLNDEQMVEQGVVCLKSRHGVMVLETRGPRYDLFEVGRDWARYYVQLQNVKNKLKLTLIECLQTGRVLAVNEKPLGATLVLPSFWDDNRLINPKDGELMFVFSVDFPPVWFQSLETLPAKKIKAIRWLENAEKRLDVKGVRASQGDYKNIMMRKFELTQNAVNDVWKQAVRIHKGASGYIPDAIRATKADLLEIEQDN